VTESTEKKLMTRQTVDLPLEAMEHFDTIKRRHGYRSFGAYVRALIAADMGMSTQTGESVIKPNTYSSQRLSEDNRIESSESEVQSIAARLERLESKIDALGEPPRRVHKPKPAAKPVPMRKGS